MNQNDKHQAGQEVDNRPADQRGRDTVTDAVDAYLLNAKDSVSAWVASPGDSAWPALVTSYLQAAATIHAAEVMAEVIAEVLTTDLVEAIDRLAAAVTLARHNVE